MGGNEYNVRISEGPDDADWDAFLVNAPGGHHVQSSLWAQVKAINHWKAVRIVVTRWGTIHAGAQLLFHSITLMASVAYITKGPVLAAKDLEIAELVIRRAIQISRANRVQILAIQPPNDGEDIALCLPAWGFQASSLELAPTASFVLDLSAPSDEILGRMKRQTRQNIRRATEAGMIVRDGDERDLDTFYAFHVATSRRQGFFPYSKDYYLRMWQVFEPGGFIRLFMAEYGGSAISGLLVIPFGDTVIAKILGWSGKCPTMRPNDAMFWSAIQWSKSQGYRYFDFEGLDLQSAKTLVSGESLPTRMRDSPDAFKLGYGGQVVLYPAAFELIDNSLIRWLYGLASPRVGGSSRASRMMDRLRKL